MDMNKKRKIENNETVTYTVGRDYTGLPIYVTHIIVKDGKHVRSNKNRR